MKAVAELEFFYVADVFEVYQKQEKADAVAIPEIKLSEIKHKSR